MKGQFMNGRNMPMPPRLSHTQPGNITTKPSVFGPLAEISPTSVSSLSTTAIPTLAPPMSKPMRGTKRKPPKATLQARQPAKKAKGPMPEGSVTGRYKVLQDPRTQSEERTETETMDSFVQPPSLVTESAAEDCIEAFTQEDIIKLLPGSQHGHAVDIFERGFWSIDLERNLRLHWWTDADEEALLRSCPTVSAGELYVWRAMPRLFGCDLPDLFRYGLGINFYPEATQTITSRSVEPNVHGVFSGVAVALCPDTARDGRHEPTVEEYFKALAKILPHPVWRGDPSRLRYVLQHAVRARVGPAHVEPLVPPYSKAPNNFAEFAWACCSAPDTSRPPTREDRCRELGAAIRWMADMYVAADKDVCDVVDNLLDMYGRNVHAQASQPEIDGQGADARNILFDLEICDLQAVHQALERTPQSVDRDPTNQHVVSTQLYAAPARFFIDDLKAAPDITNGDSLQVLAKWVRDQKREWILSRRRENHIRQRMQVTSSWSFPDGYDPPYLLDIPPFDPDGRYHMWPVVTEGQVAMIQGLVASRVRYGPVVDDKAVQPIISLP